LIALVLSATVDKTHNHQKCKISENKRNKRTDKAYLEADIQSLIIAMVIVFQLAVLLEGDDRTFTVYLFETTITKNNLCDNDSSRDEGHENAQKADGD
jgi:hypothetical protein